MPNIRIEIDGVDLLRRRLAELGPRADLGMSAALVEEGERIMKKSRPEVPTDLGTLKGSGHVSLPQRTASGVEVTFGYGGAASAYAWRQHEETGWSHTAGKAKFLEDPMRDSVSGMGARLAATLRRFLP